MDQLQQKMSELEKLTQSLLGRVCELEDGQEYLQEQIKKLQLQNEKLEFELNCIKNPQINQIEESWLFYCEKSMNSIQQCLDKTCKEIQQILKINSNFVFEFDYTKWENDSVMWREIILSFGLGDQKIDLNKLNAASMKELGIQTLRQHQKDEVLLILKSLPNQENSEHLTSLASLCESITICWNEIELDEENQGRIVVVLVTNEKLNKLEVKSGENQKVILQIEKLQ